MKKLIEYLFQPYLYIDDDGGEHIFNIARFVGKIINWFTMLVLYAVWIAFYASTEFLSDPDKPTYIAFIILGCCWIWSLIRKAQVHICIRCFELKDWK